MITIESIELALVAVITLAAMVERGVELVRPLILKIADIQAQNVVKIAAAVVIGFGTAALLQINVLGILGLAVPPVAGYAAAGVLASAGASPWHALLEWLKTIKQPK